MTIDTSRYIAFCGGENCGKSTHIDRLREVYPNALFVREPGSYQDQLADHDRELALNKKYGVEGSELELRLQTSRARQMRLIIKPALLRGDIVISDRSWFDGILYGSGIETNDIRDLIFLSKFALDNIFPTHYIYFMKSGLNYRAIEENDRYDNREDEINTKLNDYYAKITCSIRINYPEFNFMKFYNFDVDMNGSISHNQVRLQKLLNEIIHEKASK